MQSLFSRFLLISITLLMINTLKAQIPLYMNGSGQFSSYSGSSGSPLTIDEDEDGSITFSMEGPIDFDVNGVLNPDEISLSGGETGFYSGKLYPSYAYWKEGDSVETAKLYYDFQLNYNSPVEKATKLEEVRKFGIYKIVAPALLGNGQPDTFSCSKKGCDAHPDGQGKHERINAFGKDSIDFIVYKLQIKILGPTEVRQGDTVQYTADVFPENVGQIQWSNGETGNTIEVVIDHDTTLSATYTVKGISESDEIKIKTKCAGKIYHIWASAFIPYKQVPAGPTPFIPPWGIGFIWLNGDNRNYQAGGSARLWHLLDIDTDPEHSNLIITNKAGASHTTGEIVFDFLHRIPINTSIPPQPPVAKVTRNGCVVRVEITGSAETQFLKIVPRFMVPTITYTFTLIFDEKKKTLSWDGSCRKWIFPSYELYVEGVQGIDGTPFLFKEDAAGWDILNSHLNPFKESTISRSGSVPLK
jgi:hypothetical protein